MRRKTIGLWAAVLAVVAMVIPLASLDRGLAAVTLPIGNENTTIIVQNVGNANADFVADFYNPDGSIDADATQTQTGVSPGGTRTFAQALNNGLAAGWRGLSVISSTQKINTLIVRDILSTTNRKSYSIANAYETGGYELAIPIAFNELLAGGSWNSRISTVNTGTALACLKVTYFLVPDVGGSATTNQTVVDNPAGQAGCANGHRLPAGGQLTFGRAGTGVTQMPGATQNNQMAVLIEVLNPGENKVTANVDIYRSDGNRLLGSYNALIDDAAAPTMDDVGTNILRPIAMKEQSGFYTVIGVQNLTGIATDVMIAYTGVDTDNANAPVNYTATLAGVTNVGFHSTYQASEAQLPKGFVGTARVTAGQKLAAMFIRGKQTAYFSGDNEDLYTAANGVPEDRAAMGFNVPLSFRRISADIPNGYFGFNGWIQVQVADNSTATVTVRLVGDAGSASANGCNASAGPFQANFTVTGSKVFYLNADSDNGFPSGQTPSCFWGGGQVTANKPIVVIAAITADVYFNSDNDAVFNAFPQ